ncbi:MAG TPA: ribonuclease R [Gammaproteobacteria bacterium]|nr:ribonuclease R [Gammaproteobacteria bacterium]
MNQTDDWRKQDPNYEHEKRKYERPVPSRDFLVECLTGEAAPLTLEALCESLGIQDERDVEALHRRLEAMVRDGQLVENRRGGFGVAERMDLVRGRVIGHPDGFGFLVPEDNSDDVFLSPREMRGLLHGDRALVRVRGYDRRGRREGAVVSVLERNTEQVVGRYVRESGVGFVVPDNRRISQDVLIPGKYGRRARDGQIVVAEILEQPSKRSQPIGRIREVLGDHMAPGMEIDTAIRSHGIPHRWPKAVTEEKRAFGRRVPEDAKNGREDLRELPLVTIDGEDAKDFDDAVYCEPSADGWKLLVAIADVSHYVESGSALDEEARQRGNSVYFPGRVVPMLPEVLSNGLCSLNPRVDRLCLVCAMEIDRDGRVTRSGFFEGVMRSHARLTYTEVAQAVVERDPATRPRLEQVLPQLENLHAVYRALRSAREARGAIDMDSTETEIVFGPERKIERIVPVERTDAHRLIEECMIAANVEAARFLLEHRVPTLFRIHDRPAADRVEELRQFLGEFGLKLGDGDEPEPRHFARVLEEARGREETHLIQTVLMRTMSRAVYSPDNVGHFGLALDAYTHFTSPIRRYPDLLVHRAIRTVLRGGGARDLPYRRGDLENLGVACSLSEQRADEATRDAEDWLKCEYMMDKVGETFPGIIVGVTSFGVFVELSGIYVTGLVHVTALRNDYYHFDPVGQRLRGERSGHTYRLGNSLTVQVARVDLDERKIDFEPVEPAAPKEGSRRGPRKGRPGRGKRR